MWPSAAPTVPPKTWWAGGLLLCPLAQSRPGLVQLEPPDDRMNTQIWILTHPDLKQVARIRAFTQFMVEALSTHPSLAH